MQNDIQPFNLQCVQLYLKELQDLPQHMALYVLKI